MDNNCKIIKKIKKLWECGSNIIKINLDVNIKNWIIILRGEIDKNYGILIPVNTYIQRN